MKDERTRLDGWKQIANYLGRDVTTVLRWEKDKKLPVRRLPGGKRQVVFAYQEELDHWLAATTGNGIPSLKSTNSGNDRPRREESPIGTGSGDQPLPTSTTRNGENGRHAHGKLTLSQTARGSVEANPEISVEPELRNNLGAKDPIRDLGWAWVFLTKHQLWLVAISVISALILLADVLLAHPRGIHILRDEIAAGLAFVTFCCYRWSTRQRRTERASMHPSSAAFRGLLPFEPSDAHRFFGRDIEAAAVMDLVLHSEFRFGVLHGHSGCGKTSLIRAALIPRLEAIEKCVVIYCRSYKDPMKTLADKCRQRSSVERADDEPMMSYLARVCQKIESELVMIFDQFEEFYINSETQAQKVPFIDLVSACNNSKDLPIKFLFVIRSDFLYLIATAFDGYIPETLLASRRYHMRYFDEDQAVEVIEQSVRRANWQFEPGLSRKIARDLANGGLVLPSELQIIGEQLQNKRIFTLEEYKRAGGREQLVHSYLEDSISLATDQQAAKLVLRCLISDEDTRLTLPITEINKRVQRHPKVIQRILELFVQMRLIREIQDEEPWRYELSHEYLIDRINQTTGKVMDATQRANRYLRQYLSSYAVDKGTCIPLRKLWFIRRYSDLEQGPPERKLITKSYWRGLATAASCAGLFTLCVTSTAAWLSITEQWEDVRLVDGHTAAVHRAVFSPDEHLLISGGEDGKVVVWDFQRREKLASLSGHTGWVNALAFSSNGKWFASGEAGPDRRVIVWDATTFERVAVLHDHNGSIGGLAFSPDDKWLASSDSAHRTILWSTAHWQKSLELPMGVGDYGAILFSSDNHSVYFSPDLAGWDMVARRTIPPLGDHDGLNWAVLLPDNRSIVGIDTHGDVRFLDLDQRKLLAKYKAHEDNGRAVAYSPDGKTIATGADDIILWDAATHLNTGRFQYPAIVWSLSFSPDGHWLVSTHGDGSILVWDPADHKLIANLNEHSAAVRTVAYSNDGKYIASGGEDHSVILWNATNRQKERVLLGHKSKVTAVAFSPDNKSVISTDFAGETIDWDVEQHRRKWSTQATGWNQCLALSPNGLWIATSEAVYTNDGHQAEQFGSLGAWAAAFSPDSRSLIYATPGGRFVIWDPQTRKISSDQQLTTSSLIALSYSKDGKFLVTGDDQGAVRLWQANPLRPIAVLGHHAARVKSVAVSPDGTQVASAGDDQMINLWDVKTRKLVARIGTHASPVLSIAFSPDGKHLAAGEHDRSVRMYTRHHLLWGHLLD